MAALNNFKADLIYGASDTHKTTQIGKLAKYIARKLGKRTRLISADGGGWDPIQPLVDAGAIIPWQIRLWDKKVETIDKACQGWWPRDLHNPRSPLEPPTIVTYTADCYRCRDEAGKPVRLSESRAMPTNIVCPKCKAIPGPREIDVHITARHEANPANDMRGIGAYGIEGLTSLGDTMMEYLQKTSATLSQDPSYVWQDGDTNYSGGNQTYYGFVQLRLYEYVHKSHMIPYVEKVLWSGLEGRGEEEGTRTPIFGPAIVGKKATGKAPAWFGNTLHMEAIERPDGVDENQQPKIKRDVIMYCRTHLDPLTKIPFHAKTRAFYGSASKIPTFMEDDIQKLYELIDKLKAEAADSDDIKTTLSYLDQQAKAQTPNQ
jgi:hypothetical protein